jgi:hypothetical protein
LLKQAGIGLLSLYGFEYVDRDLDRFKQRARKQTLNLAGIECSGEDCDGFCDASMHATGPSASQPRCGFLEKHARHPEALASIAPDSSGSFISVLDVSVDDKDLPRRDKLLERHWNSSPIASSPVSQYSFLSDQSLRSDVSL